MVMIITNAKGEEQAVLEEMDTFDLDLGDTNGFVFEVPLSRYDPSIHSKGCQIFAPGTEYGGIISGREVTKDGSVRLSGHTWRGRLARKVIEPPAGQDYKVVSGEANTVIRSLVGDQLGSLFAVDEDDSKITIANHQIPRYVTLLEGIEGMLAKKGARLRIYYVQGPSNGVGAVHLCAVPVTDYSGEIEFSEDCRLRLSIKEEWGGINHLICLGKGDLKERLVRHLYVQADGSIGTRRHFTGLAEMTAIYDYKSADDEESLIEDGTKRLRELADYRQCEVSVTDGTELEIGDIVGGRERITGAVMKAPIAGKVLKIQKGRETIEYRAKEAD